MLLLLITMKTISKNKCFIYINDIRNNYNNNNSDIVSSIDRKNGNNICNRREKNKQKQKKSENKNKILKSTDNSFYFIGLLLINKCMIGTLYICICVDIYIYICLF